jgi:hypothetical protein
MVIEGGSIAYERDGKRYEGGLFGGDIEEAVKGNPKAEEYAREFRTGMIEGFVGTMLGIGGILGGASLVGAEASQTGSNSNATTPGLAVTGVGFVAYIVGACIMMSAAPHAYDAVNAYNDGLAGSGP